MRLTIKDVDNLVHQNKHYKDVRKDQKIRAKAKEIKSLINNFELHAVGQTETPQRIVSAYENLKELVKECILNQIFREMEELGL